MKIRLTTSLAGPAYTLSPGDEREFPEAEALRLIEAGYAVPFEDKPKETVTKRQPAKERR